MKAIGAIKPLLLVGGALVTPWLGFGVAGGGTPAPGPPAPAAAPDAARAPQFQGRTDQRPGRYGVQELTDNRVTFTVAGGRVRDFTISWISPCFDAYHGQPDAPLIDTSAFDPLMLRNGHFAISNGGYRLAPGPHQVANVGLDLRGSIHGRRASGTLSVNAAIDVDDIYTSDYCDTVTRPIRWQATLR